jgi:alkyldihydroxyacetonephosphate synthase
MPPGRKFRPDWSETPPAAGTYRAVFKYGHPARFKHPSDAWYAMLKADLGLTEADFRRKRREGREALAVERPCGLPREQVAALTAIVGPENAATDVFARTRYAYGKTAEEMMELSRGVVREIADLVLHPRHKEDVHRIVAYCHEARIPVTVYSGGSSVTLGLRPARGGVTLVMSTHMNRFLELSEADQTARVQPGLRGPAYEAALNRAPERFGARRRYTGGHFPQSFEHSTVGGWVVTLGSGQASTYYGDAADLVISQEYVTPAGRFTTPAFPAYATGPKVDDIMKGSEGAFGVLVEVTLKVFRHMPRNRRYFSFMFPTWVAAVAASREIAQGEFGRPAVYRISDPEETDRGLKLYGIPRLAERFLVKRGYLPRQRCLCLGTAEGDRGYTRLVARRIRRVARRHGAIYLTGYGSRKWEKTRYTEPYMREDLHDYGILIDTLETSVTWANLHRVHEGVRAFIKGRPRTICMTHASHFYPQGTNLYFIFIARFANVHDYRTFQAGILDRIQAHGGSLSHHHGIGRMIAPWIESHLGPTQMAVLRALKAHFDPRGIMNPGGLLGLDLDPIQRRKTP